MTPNFLIIGGGSIGKRHLRNLQSLGFHNIWVLRREDDPDFASQYQVTIITSYEDATNIDFEAVFVCTPTSLHNEGIAFAVRNDAAIFMEKPLIHEQKGLIEAKKLLKHHKGVFFIGFMLRFHPLVRKIKEVLKGGELGSVYSARLAFGSYLPSWHPWEDYKTSYASRSELGGGVINTITHELDLIQYLFSEPQAVYCEASNFGILDITVEEHCEAIFSYIDKVVSLHLDYLQKDYDRNIVIYCEEGKLVWNWHTNEIIVQKHNTEDRILGIKEGFTVNDLYIDELKAFLSLINDKVAVHDLDFKHAVKNTELMLLMHQSAAQSKKVFYEVS
ncbi:Gfo/Idh/MocA family protein [Neolewinella litorea]|uniref:Gfo/Idh/MocA family oxidoreductase n=1 Tax=Neolewinella litorea TaxID=2562452 RepID=A0A4S4NKZ9_9BACT|nr:Gfo/Idh/MocA family oxidoreductase [Neolewinella litorea]THH39517.1 Gfo/Idh/MocA family oxidoreductase [Neolewinella litorea]